MGENLVETKKKEKETRVNLDENPRGDARAKAAADSTEITRGGGIKDSRVCFAVFVRAALDANPQAGILGGGTQLGNNRCQ